jgi:hypothetical protein
MHLLEIDNSIRPDAKGLARGSSSAGRLQDDRMVEQEGGTDSSD